MATSRFHLSIPRLSDILAWGLVGLCAAAASWVVLSASAVYGMAVSSDSMFYISTADNLAAGRGVFDFSGTAMTDFPPLYTLILAALRWVSGITPFVWARFLNAGFMALVVLSFGWLLWLTFPGRRLWLCLGVFLVTVFASMYTIAGVISTDLLFILLILWFYLAAAQFLTSKRFLWLAFLVVLATSMPLLRWVGLAAPVALFFLVWAACWPDRKRALIVSVASTVAAVLPIAAWAVGRNLAQYGRISRQPGFVDFWRNLQLSGLRMSEWVAPNPALIGLPLLVLLVLALLLLNRKPDWLNWLHRLSGAQFLPVLTFSVIYSGAILVTSYTLDHLDPADDRYQVPLFFTLLLLLFSLFEDLILPHLKLNLRRAVEALAAVLLVAWGVYQAGQVNTFVAESRAEGVQGYNLYNTKQFVRSGLVVHLIRNPPEPGVTIYTNEPEAIYFFLRRQASMSPTDPQNYTADPQNLKSTYAAWPEQQPAVLVWFKPNIKRGYYDPNQLRSLVDLEKIYRAWDGEYYRVIPKE